MEKHPNREFAALSVLAMQLRERFAERGPAWTAEQVMQGFVGDVGDLMKLVMARQGLRTIPDADVKLGHELADCLWSVLVLARLYEVDLESEFVRMIDEISRRLETSSTSPSRA